MRDHDTNLSSGTLKILAQMPIMLLVWQSQPMPRLLFASPSFCKKTGYTPEAQSHTTTFIQTLFPDHNQELMQILAQPATLPCSLELTCEPAFGPSFQAILRLSELEDSPGQFVLGCLEPITTPKVKSENTSRIEKELLTAIIEASPLPIYTVTNQGLVTSWNPAAELVFGFSAEETVGKPLPIVQTSSQPEFEQIRTQVLAGQIYKNVEVKRSHKSGRELSLSLNIAPLYDEKGQCSGILAVTEDITQRKQAEEELKTLNSKLEERVQERTSELEAEIQQRKQIELQLKKTNTELAHALRIKDEFLANMSHELRTPLTAILGLTELLLEKESKDKNRQFLSTIYDSGQHLLSLINDILDLAKIGAAHLTLRPEWLSLDDVCENSLRLVRQMAHIKRQTIRYESFSEPISIKADPVRLKQILVNLLSNAVKFTWVGGQITLRTRLSEMTGEVIIEIEDTGIGISTDDLEQIFEPFIQLDSGLNRQAGGTGLGLALVRHLTRLHQGQVNVSSILGQGSIFSIHLPLNPEKSIARLEEEINLSPRGQGERILLVENNPQKAFDLESYLSELGYEVQVTQTNSEMLEQLPSPCPDLVVLDLHLLDLKVHTVLNNLQALGGEKIPVMALTGQSSKINREEILAAGAHFCMAKPFALHELATKMRELLAS
jgi:PAS domain S-box-containing protein